MRKFLVIAALLAVSACAKKADEGTVAPPAADAGAPATPAAGPATPGDSTAIKDSIAKAAKAAEDAKMAPAPPKP